MKRMTSSMPSWPCLIIGRVMALRNIGRYHWLISLRRRRGGRGGGGLGYALDSLNKIK
jgi:hypothetical protein